MMFPLFAPWTVCKSKNLKFVPGFEAESPYNLTAYLNPLIGVEYCFNWIKVNILNNSDTYKIVFQCWFARKTETYVCITSHYMWPHIFLDHPKSAQMKLKPHPQLMLVYWLIWCQEGHSINWSVSLTFCKFQLSYRIAGQENRLTSWYLHMLKEDENCNPDINISEVPAEIKCCLVIRV